MQVGGRKRTGGKYDHTILLSSYFVFSFVIASAISLDL